MNPHCVEAAWFVYMHIYVRWRTKHHTPVVMGNAESGSGAAAKEAGGARGSGYHQGRDTPSWALCTRLCHLLKLDVEAPVEVQASSSLISGR